MSTNVAVACAVAKARLAGLRRARPAQATTRLTNMVVQSVDLVDAAANLRDFVVAKGADGRSVELPVRADRAAVLKRAVEVGLDAPERAAAVLDAARRLGWVGPA
jgi:hypothetical protein